MGAIVAKNLMQPFSHPMLLQIKFGNDFPASLRDIRF